MNFESLRPEIQWAVAAAQDKQASDITVLKLSANVAFAEYFLLCSGQSHPQLQAIAEAIEEMLETHGVRVTHREGKGGAEWRLLDYGGFVVHIFSSRAREYYDLERLWRNAERWDADVEGSEKRDALTPEPEHGEAQQA